MKPVAWYRPTSAKLGIVNDFSDLFGYRLSNFGITEVVQAERDPQSGGHQSPPELKGHRVGGRQPSPALVAVVGAHLLQEPLHPREALLEFLDGKSVERRTHHDAGLKFLCGLSLLGWRAGLTQPGPGIGEMLQSRRQQLAFASEMAMQQTVIHPGPRRDLTNGCRGWTFLGEQLAGRCQHSGDDLFFAERLG